MKPPMPYYGGKQRIADRIVALFPPHVHYVEPFAGGLSVFLAKPASKIETLNDLDRELMTFWRVLRDRHDDLVRVAMLTPHSRTELDLAREPMDDLDELEVARRVWVQLTQGRAGRRTRTGWRFYLGGDSSANSGMDRYLAAYIDRMPPAAGRLATAQLECKPALEVIAQYDSPGTLFYLDPPYLSSTRRSKQYVHELDTAAEHRELADALQHVTGAVCLSGYRSPLYDELYAGWHQVKIPASTQQAGIHARRTEVVWMNYAPAADLFTPEVAS